MPMQILLGNEPATALDMYSILTNSSLRCNAAIERCQILSTVGKSLRLCVDIFNPDFLRYLKNATIKFSHVRFVVYIKQFVYRPIETSTLTQYYNNPNTKRHTLLLNQNALRLCSEHKWLMEVRLNNHIKKKLKSYFKEAI